MKQLLGKCEQTGLLFLPGNSRVAPWSFSSRKVSKINYIRYKIVTVSKRSPYSVTRNGAQH